MTKVELTRVRGVNLHRLPLVQEPRGSLSFGEFGRHVPFIVKRYFLVFNVAGGEIRGEHAHRSLRQFLICVNGACHITADDGETRQEFVLNHPATALELPPLCWSVQDRFTPDCVLLVLASECYDPADYIRDYSEFQSLRRATS